jgi:hypothetical protein
MNKENTERLIKRSPFLYQTADLPPNEALMCFGFACGDGWFEIINELSDKIEHYNHRKKSHKGLCFKMKYVFALCAAKAVKFIFQYKNYYFRLKWTSYIYSQCNNVVALNDPEPVIAMQVKEKFGGLRFYTNGTSDEIHKLISEYESKSYATCEDCGKPGKSRGSGWIRTLCDECGSKRAGYEEETEEGEF